MSAIKRYELIMQHLLASGEVTVGELAERLHVTGKTIRQDFEKLEGKGLLRRTHGGAVLASDSYSGLFREQEAGSKHPDEKQQAARCALAHIGQGDIIALDSGSTTLEIAKLLDNMPLTVITNDLYVIGELIKKDQIRLVVPGGVRSRNQLVNENAGNFLRKLNVQKAFLSTTGIHLEYGLTIFTQMHAEQKRALIESAREVYCVADHSKFDKCALFTFAKLQEVGTVLTDAGLTDELLHKYETAGVRIERFLHVQ
ncbi:DeoR/GlpR family DNA-binding transcription regulator [Paenibacillus filicis]|uniref:DeoR/GlpR family DNA-binding transcription regulator n=1 Tax=Paenibacillus gyeongsangnamensis TaxID=3388067 RepID=A0ABT4QJS1_9BACL|nr:DeoR/GlpR family DNA-binding transcription regulator [Paenibacillus filicis]MCZ8517121.1 DeoR/GlpR family DNA-binding transcription regulator [Paenibacillus filicis]